MSLENTADADKFSAMSIVEVAKLAGVSSATVSRVINCHPNVSSASVLRVRAAMQKLGYVPPAKRRGPKRKSSGIRAGTIGMLFFGEAPTLATSPVMALVLHAIQDALAAHGLNLTLGQIKSDSGLPPNVANGQVDGLFLQGLPPSAEIQQQLSRYPACVWLLSQRRRLGYWGDRVSPDNFTIGTVAAKYLVGRGHSRVAALNCDPSHLGFTTRIEGFESAARAAGVFATTLADKDNSPINVGPSPGDDAPFDALVDQLLAVEGGMPTGLFVPRDPLTIRMYRVLRMRGVKPGRDIEIVSCDNVPELAGLDPRPATIDIRPGEIGRRAVEQLLWHINNRAAAINVTSVVEPALVPGDQVDRDSFQKD
ncbi:MAG: LacI family DNA-binding transcriptional regulator [Lentisphaeria bacterium]|nr:LacI family DNA-binding transcriptional regulator [Lentisphaeria bacterium]